MRSKYPPSEFNIEEKLYRGFSEDDLTPNTNNLNVNSVRFPDFSCNWSRFSLPKDIRKRENSDPTDGCYSFTVKVSQYRKMATPCHDPLILSDMLKSNYAHVEVRQLRSDETICFEPPKGRKLKTDNWSRSKRLMYRQNIINNLITEIKIGEFIGV